MCEIASLIRALVSSSGSRKKMRSSCARAAGTSPATRRRKAKGLRLMDRIVASRRPLSIRAKDPRAPLFVRFGDARLEDLVAGRRELARLLVGGDEVLQALGLVEPVDEAPALLD